MISEDFLEKHPSIRSVRLIAEGTISPFLGITFEDMSEVGIKLSRTDDVEQVVLKQIKEYTIRQRALKIKKIRKYGKD